MKEENWNEWKDESQPTAEKGEGRDRPCCSACQNAKELKCVCSCQGRNHSIRYKIQNHSLDDFEFPVDFSEIVEDQRLV